MRQLAGLLALTLLSGCSFSTLSAGGSAPGIAALGGIAYYAKDGFTWEVEDRRIGEDTYRLTVKQGKFKQGGQGEAEVYFKRRAEEIAALQGCDGYTILELTQSLHSDILNVPQRVTEGVIRCNPPKPKATKPF